LLFLNFKASSFYSGSISHFDMSPVLNNFSFLSSNYCLCLKYYFSASLTFLYISLNDVISLFEYLKKWVSLSEIYVHDYDIDLLQDINMLLNDTYESFNF